MGESICRTAEDGAVCVIDHGRSDVQEVLDQIFHCLGQPLMEEDEPLSHNIVYHLGHIN